MIKGLLIAVLSAVLAMLIMTRMNFSETEQAIVVIPEEKVVSIQETNDTFTLEFYSVNHAYLNADSIETVMLKGDYNHRFEVVDLKKAPINLDGVFAEKLLLTLRVRHQLDQGYERYQNTPLIIELLDGTKIKLPIGPLTLVHERHTTTSLSYRQVHNIPGYFSYGVTARGFIIELENLSDDALSLESIDIFASQITIDHDAIKAYDKPLDELIFAKTIFNNQDNLKEAIEWPFELAAKTRKTLLVPFVYQDESSLLHRYPIHIQSSKGGLYIPSFPYINTTLYLPENLPLKAVGHIDDPH